MRLRLRIDRRSVRRWHADLLGRLAAYPGVVADVEWGQDARPLPAGVDTLFQLEAVVFGVPRTGLADRRPPSSLDAFPAATDKPDVVLDLCGDATAVKGRVWTLTFGGVPGESALIGLLIANETPRAEIVEANAVIAAGRLGTEYGGIVLASFEDMLARLTTLIVAAARGTPPRQVPTLPSASPAAAAPQPASSAIAIFAAKQLARAVVQRIYRLCYYSPHWRIGWRRLDGPDLFDSRSLGGTAWTELKDDGLRFYADPVPIARDGKVTLFVEEFPHKLGRGIISVVGFGPQGPVGTPRPVLEQPVHLSYPFVFERDGQVWMVPESSAAGTIDLFRADPFPDRWVKEATLVAGIAASDATLFEHGGRWWMLATVRDGGGAFSDALHAWSAPGFRGPWTPHAGNPLIIDIASARPAGPVVQRGGAVLRPVQDCRRSYGAALGIARIDRLDDQGFGQTVETILGPAPEWPGRRLHTLGSAGGVEFIDGSAQVFKWQRLPR